MCLLIERKREQSLVKVQSCKEKIYLQKTKLRKINLSNIQSEIGQGVQPKQSKPQKKKDSVSTG